MNYSKRHKNFASNLNFRLNIHEQDVLEYPEQYLGPNYKEILNFWFYWDSLSDKQQNVYCRRIAQLDPEVLFKARELAKEVIKPIFIYYLWTVEYEIFASHLYLERNIPFTFLPLIFDL
jgi:hypothetical protein